MPSTSSTSSTFAAELTAESLAGLCRQFDQLIATGYHSTRTAALELGRSPSMFSGPDSPYARFKLGGHEALVSRSRGNETPSSIRHPSFVIPPWFIPAARFFYLLSNRAAGAGSVPEAIRRTISLPALPFGWTESYKQRLLRKLNSDPSITFHGSRFTEIPACPESLRSQILAREAAGRPLVPRSIAKQIIVNPSTVKYFRSPREWSLAFQSAPGSQRRYTDHQTGERRIMLAGDWFGGDDATPGIAVCVPCNEVITLCSEKFGVLLGRFQWLPYHDCRTDKILAYDYVIRPRGSYRAEDILNGMGAVVRTHGIPRLGWQFEGGTWNSKLVRQSIDLMGCDHWRTYSPHQKAIESVFNRVWTRLAVQFPHADMGRRRMENQRNCLLYEACKAGHKDPRRYFPTVEILLQVFADEVAAHNSKLIKSEQYGQWIPDRLFAGAIAENPLRKFSPEMSWIFSPFAADRTVRGMMVRCLIPMFENFSVPFEFGADWLPLYDGKKVRLHFNPREPRCLAKIVLLQNAGQKKPGAILGDAKLIGETASHIRYLMEWGDDDQRAGYLQRQRVANFVRRETRGVGVGGRAEYSASEQRDGLARLAKVEHIPGSAPAPGAVAGAPPDTSLSNGTDITGSGDPETAGAVGSSSVPAPSALIDRAGRPQSPQPATPFDATAARAARRAELAELERQTENLFL
jgi:hypothetical protein